ncbi:nucleotide disphospho-sugar-binding domain-containing protein [Rugosimonospora africana]|nr:nucleotide disphospho-sugar-binding domain-containing protein [Rugosimonospora africana]
MAKLIVAAAPLYAFVAPMRAIASDLSRRGHDITFLTGSRYRDCFDGIGVRFEPLTGVADFDIGRLDELVPGRNSAPPGPQRIALDLQRLFVEPIPAQHHSLQGLLAAAGDEPVVLLQDTTFQGAAPVRYGAPGLAPAAIVGIGLAALPVSSVDTAPFGLGLPPDSSPEGRARNRAANAEVERVFCDVQGRFLALLSGLGATEVPPFVQDNQVLMPDRYLQLTVAALEYPRSDAPPGLRYVGPLPGVADTSRPLPPWWDDVLAARRVIVVSQGTLANRDFSELVEPALRGLADSDALVVATLGRDATLSGVPDNARVAAFVPYSDLLPHADVFVSNGGYGGVQQALGFGVPMVLAGLSEDKAEITARTAWTGAAINLATQRPTEEDIRASVEAVLSTPSYRRNAERLRADIARHDPYGEIAATVDELSARA